MNEKPEQGLEHEPEYVSISEVAGRLQTQDQYTSYYLKGLGGKPNLGEGIRYHGSIGQYHEIEFHPDDVEEFIRRIEEHRSNQK